MPENTISSFKKAVELGADAIELDVHLCKSREIVVIHDDTVDRTTNGTGKVGELTLDEIKALDIEGGEKIPTLREVLEQLECQIFIEIKAGWAAIGVAEMVAEFGHERLNVISFNENALSAVAAMNNKIKTGLNIENEISSVEGAFYSVNPSIQLITPQLVEMIHSKGMKVFTWTVNGQEDLQKAVNAGVDGIMSDNIYALTF